MAEYFKTPSDLSTWVQSKESSDSAADMIMEILGSLVQDPTLAQGDELDVKEACQAIYEQDDDNASQVLFKVLARHNLTEIKKEASKMDKQAQTSKQRNDWVKGERNKWNRSVDGFNAATPWRVDRDQFYDFTHYHTDEIRFDEDPERVYSGEAIWRMYVMDKFYREHKTADGKWVGGYINDRFHVFPDAGTPDNPGVPRDQGNPMGLGLNERTRKPRPHQFSTERRLEEARGNETYDLTFTTAAGTFSKIMKTANSLPKERETDPVYNIFKDCIEMKEAGISYDEIIDRVSDHYDASITGVAQIAKFAEKMVKKHDGIAYEFGRTAGQTFITPSNLTGTLMTDRGPTNPVDIARGTTLVNLGNGQFEISSGQGIGTKVMLQEGMDIGLPTDIQQTADELGLNEASDEFPIMDAPEMDNLDVAEDFTIDEV